MSTHAVTKSIRTALRTMTAALGACDIPRTRNAARYALRVLGKGHLLPALSAPLGHWSQVVEVVELSCQIREASERETRALFARNAAA